MKITKTPRDGGPTFSVGNRVYRVIWNLTWFLFCSWTPPALWRWRLLVLRIFGARVAFRCDVRGSAKVWCPSNLVLKEGALMAEKVNCYNVAVVVLERGALVSQGAYLCTASHDISKPDFPLVSKPIVMEANCWVASEAFVGPGVIVGEGAVLGARAAAFHDLDAWSVYRGNPAILQKNREIR